MQLEKHRQYAAIDIAKYISALLVVAIHTFPFVEISEEFNLFFISTICRLAVPFFFVCSGYFLFRKIGKNSRENQKVILRYLRRLGILYLVWTVIYIPYTIWNYMDVGFSLSALLGWVRDFFLNGSYYHLWFLPALMLGVWIVYRLMSFRGLRFTLTVSVVLYVIGYIINIYGPIWQTIPNVDIVYGFFTKILVTPRDGIFFAPVFVAMGAWIARTKRPPLMFSAIGFGISFLCLILEVTLYYSMGVLQDLSSMFLMLLPCSWFLMNMLLSISIPYEKVYGELRQDSTLIYVSHILFARILLILLPNAHLVVYLLTLAFSSMFAWMIVLLSRRWTWLKVIM